MVLISCDKVWYAFQDYTGTNNRFTLYVDDMSTPALEVVFGENLTTAAPFKYDPTISHTVRYAIDADDPDAIYDFVSAPETTAPCPLQPVTISAGPSFTPPTCRDGGTLLLPVIGGVSWAGGQSGDGPGAYTLTAVAQAGYTISGPATFALTVPGPDRALCAPLPTLALVTPHATMQQATCLGGAGSYTLSDTRPAVQWLVNGIAANPGTFSAAAGSTVKVEATLTNPLLHGWNDPADPTSWTFVFTAPSASCDLPTLPVPPTLPATGPAEPLALWITAAVILAFGGGCGLYLTIRRTRSLP
jgi:hypothetical protein